MSTHERNKTVDGLKGIAIVIVILHHFILAFYPAVIGGYKSLVNTKIGFELFIFKTPLSFIVAGYFAVSLFFLITGYVLTKKVIRAEGEAREHIAKAIFSRIFRLMPLIGVILAIGFILMNLQLTYNVSIAHFTKSQWFASFFPLGKVSFQTIVVEFFTKIPFVVAAKYYNVLWIIPSILFGSWLVYGFAYFFHKNPLRYAMYFILLLAFYNGHFISFLFGMMIAENEEKINPPALFLYLGLLFSLLFGSSTIKALDIKALVPYANIVKSLSAAFFFIAFQKIAWLNALAQLNIFTYLGRSSYYYYLTHMLALITLPAFVFSLIIPGGRYYQAVFVTFVLYCIVTVLYSEVLKKIEQRFILKQ